ncbi:MAG: 2-oxoacid:ferredoxin oxidoreductase subunit beta [SAR86 cluster bacterium]|uniref:2-oxoacid:ferredoxin oxidoreductase subunit beta n=1 Tax=SAR86 cluster bacterium TaxID=2030880 RepID=A0A2A4MJH0_9GAMM|nr:MAG: 2-oxoacid:ferredoxin oxidoreductase subunit beta [SAR86 cluster bacterium]
MNQQVDKLTLKDFASDQEVRWCPGCGDYAILKTIQRLMPTLDKPKEKQVFISGIGCSSRFPYYMNTYGFHTIHGRAPAIATGVKLANPDLDVWVITGDGDGFSIGGNHMLHVLRRNVNLQILLFNNEIYGLTKGQYSPTSQLGTKSPSSPKGSLDLPLSPCLVALGSGGSFIARSIDTEAKHLTSVVMQGHDHVGAAFIEILQNCPIYNDGIFENVKNKKLAVDFKVVLEQGKPLLFGKDNCKGIRLDVQRLQLEVIELGEQYSEADVLVHDSGNKVLAQMLSAMSGPDFPVAVGVLYQQQKSGYIDAVHDQLDEVRKDKRGHLKDLLNSGHTWTVS